MNRELLPPPPGEMQTQDIETAPSEAQENPYKAAFDGLSLEELNRRAVLLVGQMDSLPPNAPEEIKKRFSDQLEAAIKRRQALAPSEAEIPDEWLNGKDNDENEDDDTPPSYAIRNDGGVDVVTPSGTRAIDRGDTPRPDQVISRTYPTPAVANQNRPSGNRLTVDSAEQGRSRLTV